MAIADKFEAMEVMSKFSFYWDNGKTEDVLELFTKDCIVNTPMADSENKEEFREFIEFYFSDESDVTERFHIVANPWIELDGKTAVGKWHSIGAYTIKEVGATWIFGYYDVDLVKQETGWQIQKMQYDVKYVTPYTDGWAETPLIDEA